MFEDDPFFADHRNAMNSMMRGFGGGFDGGFNAIEDGRGQERREGQRQQRQQQRQQRQQTMNPFDQMHQQMNSMMRGMMNMNIPDMNGGGGGGGGNGAHSFSHSSVFSYTSDGQGPPKVFQASKEERQGPGGAKETKKAVKDSVSGMQRMAVGHHLGERGHVIERSHNVRSGEREEKQDFIGLQETDGPGFHREWTEAARGGERRQQQQQQRRQVGDRSSPRQNDDAYRERRGQRRALPDSLQNPRDQMLK